MPSSGCKTCALDRKSTRLNSSHTIISYAVSCLKKKTQSLSRSAQTPDSWRATGRGTRSQLGGTVQRPKLTHRMVNARREAERVGNFFFNDPATTETYPLSLHDALPISPRYALHRHARAPGPPPARTGCTARSGP